MIDIAMQNEGILGKSYKDGTKLVTERGTRGRK